MTVSRKLVTIAAILLPAGAPAAESLPMVLGRYAALTSVTVSRCSHPSDSREIVVCGRRQADRWRVPLVTLEPGDPRAETVSMERNRLAKDPPLPCGIGAFLARCGMAGVTASTRFRGDPVRFRTPAD